MLTKKYMPDIKLDKTSTRAPEKFDKEKTKAALPAIYEELDELQNVLYAQGKYAVLIVLQGMDAAGKDGLIKNVSGAVRLEHWGDLYTNIQMRGSQIQAFRNGFNVVASYWGPLTEDMSFVDRVEFVKGPAGFMLGTGDPSGLYNVVTKKPTGENKGEVSFTAGSYDFYRGAVDIDRKLTSDGKLLFRLNGHIKRKVLSGLLNRMTGLL